MSSENFNFGPKSETEPVAKLPAEGDVVPISDVLPPVQMEKKTKIISKEEKNSIIGHQGSTINEIMSRSGAMVTLKDSVVVEVAGTLEQVNEARKLIDQVLDDTAVRKENIKIKEDQVPGLIGGRGSKIRSLMETTGATILIRRSEDNSPFVEISGTKGQVDPAKKLIFATLDELPELVIEMRTRENKIKLVGLDQETTLMNVLELVSHARSRPSIKFIEEDPTRGKVVLMEFVKEVDKEYWLGQFNGLQLHGRTICRRKDIVLRKSDSVPAKSQ